MILESKDMTLTTSQIEIHNRWNETIWHSVLDNIIISISHVNEHNMYQITW